MPKKLFYNEYVRIFCSLWNPHLDDDEEMRAALHAGVHDNMLAIEFYPANKLDAWDFQVKKNTWDYILEQLGQVLPQPTRISQIIMDGPVHVFSENRIIIIKRNEKRLWTCNLARRDADATLCRVMLATLGVNP